MNERSKQPGRKAERTSLKPLTTEEALRALLRTPLPTKEADGKSKNGRRQRPD